jgi:hypothetical protein
VNMAGGGGENHCVTLFATRALALFLFGSRLPLASNGLPSSHKSQSHRPFHLSSFAAIMLCLVYYILNRRFPLTKSRRDNGVLSSSPLLG